MSIFRRIAYSGIAVLAIVIAACGGGDTRSASGGKGAAGERRVWITSPAEGDTIIGGAVEVQMNVDGVKLVPVASGTSPKEAGEGHIELFLDAPPTTTDVPVPQDPRIVHLGNGAASHVFSTMTPGPHRIIVLVSHNDHTVDKAVRSDTVNVIVK